MDNPRYMSRKRLEELFPRAHGVVICSKHMFYCGGVNIQMADPLAKDTWIYRQITCPVCGKQTSLNSRGGIAFHVGRDPNG